MTYDRNALQGVAFSWSGLPQYGARLLRRFREALPLPLHVIATRPGVPIRGVVESLGQDVIWVERGDRSLTWRKLGLRVPITFFQSGWSEPAFMALGREVSAAGGRVVLTMDTNLKRGLLHKYAAPVRFRIRFGRQFDAVFVPGRSGQQVARRFGFDDDRIEIGLLGSDPQLFSGGPPLNQRPKEFLYVGRLIPLKDVLGLCEAFIKIAPELTGWSLRICGSGSQRNQIPSHPKIHIEDFVQPADLVGYFHAARIFVLPSLKEPWGLVVHEAASCGNGLILSDAVGAAEDLAGSQNALLFPAGNRPALEARLIQAARWSAARLSQAEAESRELAAAFGPARFAESAQALAGVKVEDDKLAASGNA